LQVNRDNNNVYIPTTRINIDFSDETSGIDTVEPANVLTNKQYREYPFDFNTTKIPKGFEDKHPNIDISKVFKDLSSTPIEEIQLGTNTSGKDTEEIVKDFANE
jgi:hypothetical protein